MIVLTTWPVDRDAAELAAPLVEERLAACVNVLPPMRSFYRWQGRVQVDAEHQVIVKTTAARVDALRARLSELHPYEVPEFVVVRIEAGSEAYLSWLAESVRNGPAE